MISMLTEPCSVARKSNVDKHLGWQFISWAETCDVRYVIQISKLCEVISASHYSIFGQFQVAEKYQHPA
jgi:hypothetical protein